MLLRIRVVDNRIVPPDLQDRDARLYEWAPNHDGVLSEGIKHRTRPAAEEPPKASTRKPAPALS